MAAVLRYCVTVVVWTGIAWLLSACATNPVTGGSDFVLMSEDQEISLGKKYNSEILEEMPAYPDPMLEELVQRVGKQLASHCHRPGLDYHFTIVDSPQVNAFALPGGYIYITRGMLAYLNSEAELAAVLGHEIGHVTARHSVRQQSTSAVTGILGAVLAASTGIQGADSLTNLAGTAIVRGYGREHELEADRLGAEYLARSGYDPEAMLQVVSILKNQEAFETEIAKKEGRQANVYHGLFSTHPDNDARFREVITAAKKYKTGNTSRTGHDSYLLRLDGMTFGDSEREGVVRGNHFYHKDLDFSLTFPPGWKINNQTSRVIATPKANDGLIQLTMDSPDKKATPRQFMQQRMQLDNMRQGKAFNVEGLKGYTAVATGKTPYGQRRIRYVVVNRDNNVYILAGTARSTDQAGKYDADILATAKSLHPLTRSEKKLATGKRLDIIRAPQGSTWAGLAQRSPIANYPEEQLRLLNDQYPTGEPGKAEMIKIVLEHYF
ncbi:MAG: M48 family metalloprotease [Pseudomonadota bacterium]